MVLSPYQSHPRMVVRNTETALDISALSTSIQKSLINMVHIVAESRFSGSISKIADFFLAMIARCFHRRERLA